MTKVNVTNNEPTDTLGFFLFVSLKIYFIEV